MFGDIPKGLSCGSTILCPPETLFWTRLVERCTIGSMFRSLVHLGLIALLVCCPVLCTMGVDVCCASESHGSAISTSDQQQHACCHHGCESGNEGGSASADSGNESPAHHPAPQEDCRCDCLCNGAVASSEDVVSDLSDSRMPAADTFFSADAILAAQRIAAPPPLPPDLLSGRDIRLARMSLQI